MRHIKYVIVEPKVYLRVMRLIVEAQNYSDKAKKDWYNSRYYYNEKAERIGEALSLLKTNNIPSIKYRRVLAPDQNGYNSIITYFEITYCGTTKQISFHCPLGRDNFWFDQTGTQSILWDKKSSQKTARWLQKILRYETKR